MVSTIIFDAFGTIVRPVGSHGSYWKLASLMPGSNHLLRRRELMTVNRSFTDFAREHDLEDQLAQTAEELRKEVEAISLYEDSAAFIDVLRFRGYKVAVCSNLAHDYGIRLKEILPETDGVFLSCEVGAVKPEPAIFRAVVDGLGVAPQECLFVGDTPRQDVKGPREFGMSAMLIERNRFSPPISEQVGAVLREFG
jgi:HAD superfamily hydrolase (TIGR01549 family)